MRASRPMVAACINDDPNNVIREFQNFGFWEFQQTQTQTQTQILEFGAKKTFESSTGDALSVSGLSRVPPLTLTGRLRQQRGCREA